MGGGRREEIPRSFDTNTDMLVKREARAKSKSDVKEEENGGEDAEEEEEEEEEEDEEDEEEASKGEFWPKVCSGTKKILSATRERMRGRCDVIFGIERVGEGRGGGSEMRAHCLNSVLQAIIRRQIKQQFQTTTAF